MAQGMKDEGQRTKDKGRRAKARQTFPAPPDRSSFNAKEWALIQRLRTPKLVQDFLRDLPYNWEKKGETLRTFRQVVRHGQAHCLEAALAAATILEQHGYPPLFLDLESQDKLDHVLFIFRHKGLYGTVARSRDFGLHGRRPVFRTVRELVMSYVDTYVDNSARLTGYGVFDLRTLRRCDWRLSERNVWAVEKALIEFPHQKLRTSTRRHEETLRKFRAFRKRFPQGPVTFYSGQYRWF